jgi:hypothetical protein
MAEPSRGKLWLLFVSNQTSAPLFWGLVLTFLHMLVDKWHLRPICKLMCKWVKPQVKGIPFLVFDAGGVLEMFDPKEFSDNVVFEPTLAALKRKLAHVVERGRIKTVQLAEHITTGRQQWLQWHADFAESLPRLIQVTCCLDGHMHRAFLCPEL